MIKCDICHKVYDTFDSFLDVTHCYVCKIKYCNHCKIKTQQLYLDFPLSFCNPCADAIILNHFKSLIELPK